MFERRIAPAERPRSRTEARYSPTGHATRFAGTFAAALTLALALLVGAGFTAVRAPHAMAAGGCALSRPSLAQDFEEADLLRRLNEYRTRNGLGALALSPALMAAAAWKSTDLGANAYFSHDDLFRSWLQRLRDCGYTASVNVAENLAAGNADAASTFAQWQSSSGHNVNMLNPSMRVVGIARAFSASSPYGWYWTADFAAVADGDVAAASPPPAAPAGGHGAVTADGAATTSSSGAAPALNATVVVSGTGDCLRVHDAPTIGANVVGCLPDGTAMIVSAGPISADGYTWWKLGALGWAAGQYLAAGQ